MRSTALHLNCHNFLHYYFSVFFQNIVNRLISCVHSFCSFFHAVNEVAVRVRARRRDLREIITRRAECAGQINNWAYLSRIFVQRDAALQNT